MVAGGLQVALEEVQLRVAQRKPCDRHAEVRRRGRLRAQQLHVERDAVCEVARVDADVIDARAHGACREPRIVAQKFQRSYPGNSASTSAFIVPNVVSGLSAKPSAKAWMIDSLKSIRG